MGLKVIITGVTGMVGEGVLEECLASPDITEILVMGRRLCGFVHPKIREVIYTDFFKIPADDPALKGYDACFFCLGVSSIGMKEEDYYKATYSLTMNFAKIICELNPGMTFCYVSGSATDSSEQGRIMWARIKGKTENDLAKLPFKNEYNFRPAFMQPGSNAKNTLKYYKYVSWLYPVLKTLFPNYFIRLSDLGKAMINAALKGYDKNIIEVRDILILSKS